MSKSRAYISTQDAMRQLVEQHAILVRRIAQHLLARLPASVQLEDLIQAGMIGLMEASKNFDPGKGASFETFAGIRIRGSMLDEIRRGDWVPRSVHKNSRRISEAINAVEKETGKDARDVEIAEQLDVSLDEYHSMLSDVSSGKLLGVDDLGVSDDILSNEAQRKMNLPLEGVEAERFQQSLAEQIEQLPEREALVLSLYYDEELNLREIGEVMNVSESRVSQIHSQAMHRLRTRMKGWVG